MQKWPLIFLENFGVDCIHEILQNKQHICSILKGSLQSNYLNIYTIAVFKLALA